MSKPKNFSSLPPEEQEAWLAKAREKCRKYYAANLEKAREYDRKYYAANLEKAREYDRKYYAANLEKVRESCRKYRAETTTQTAADQFFLLAGAAEQISEALTKRKK